MRDLAIAIAVGWFWLLFYGVGPLNSATEIAVGGATLVVGCLVSAMLGLLVAARRRPGRR